MPKGDADVSTSLSNKFNDLFSIPMQQFITKQLCPQLRLNFARIGFCQGRAQECFKCESSPDNRLNWSAIKCTPNSHLLKHSTNSQICSAGMFSPIELYTVQQTLKTIFRFSSKPVLSCLWIKKAVQYHADNFKGHDQPKTCWLWYYLMCSKNDTRSEDWLWYGHTS